MTFIKLKVSFLGCLRVLLFLSAGLNFLVLTAVKAFAQNTQIFKQTQLQKTLDNWRARSGIPGAALSVYLPDHTLPITLASGITDYQGRRSVDSAALFQAGSITKSFTSMMMLSLAAEGKLNINDRLVKYLPQYVCRWPQVTLRQLLNHTSGIFNYTEAGEFNVIRKNYPQAQFTPEKIVQIAGAHQDYFPSGKGWKYSNTNYVLAGMVISKSAGKPAGDMMNDFLRSRPGLNLTHTYYVSGIYSNAFIARMAHGYSSNGIDVTTDNMSWANTAGAVVTTAQDLVIWWRGLFQGNVLPPKQMAQMMSLVCEGSYGRCLAGQPIAHLSDRAVGKGYGLGVIQNAFGSERTGSVWWHNGSTKGYKALVMWYPKSNIYIALTINRDPGYLLKPDLPIIRHILDILLPNSSVPLGRFHHPAGIIVKKAVKRTTTQTSHKTVLKKASGQRAVRKKILKKSNAKITLEKSEQKI